jgi:hypothetical protein
LGAASARVSRKANEAFYKHAVEPDKGKEFVQL